MMRSTATTLLCVGASALSLGACALRGDPTEESAGCTKLSELKIGMTMPEALLSCGRKPLRTSDVILARGIQEITWSYAGSYLHFVDGKLKSIQDVR